MTTWSEANRVAMLGAAQAHGDYTIDTAVWPVDIYGTIARTGIVLMWQRLPQQFGAYVNEQGSRPGILINSGLPHAAQRQTAGHELGHHWWKHGTRVDANLDPPGAKRPPWTTEEKTAEAFGAWFLMPRRAVLAALSLLGIQRPRSPEDVYQLSLLLGTPYRATVRHLPNIRLADQGEVAAWIRVPPNVIKERLDLARSTPRSRRPDVWVLSPRFAGTQLSVHPGDRIVISGPGDGGYIVTCPEGLMGLPVRASGRSVVVEVDASHGGCEPCEVSVASPASSTDATEQWEFSIQVEVQRSGIDPRCMH